MSQTREVVILLRIGATPSFKSNEARANIAALKLKSPQDKLQRENSNRDDLFLPAGSG
ncbi:MAG: hypothetical protein ACRDF4_04390 [Rhabdochlamydiaceae bacterium]